MPHARYAVNRRGHMPATIDPKANQRALRRAGPEPCRGAVLVPVESEARAVNANTALLATLGALAGAGPENIGCTSRRAGRRRARATTLATGGLTRRGA